MAHRLQRTEEEIDSVLNMVAEEMDGGGSSERYPGKTYAEGIEAGLAWVLGLREEHPYSDDATEEGVEEPEDEQAG